MIIEVKNLSYEYPSKRVLKNVSFKIKKGSITALVGPNGAGKTTLMRCIAALDKPFSGEVMVGGIDALTHPREVHKQIGYLSDFFGVYKDLTVEQCLRYIASIHYLSSTVTEKRIKEVAGNLDLLAYLKTEAGTLSRGLKQRLGIAQAIIHHPKVLILDEPASGLDPEARSSLSVLFKKLQKQGLTILVSSHILSELEDYCTDMLLLRDGKIVNHYDHDTEEKQGKLSSQYLKIVLTEVADTYKDDILKILKVSHLKVSDNTVECTIAADEMMLNTFLKKLMAKHIPICQFVLQKKRLQDVYMDHTDEGDQHEM